MVTINEDKESIIDTRIRKLLQKDDFLHDRNNKISNRTYKKEYEIIIDLDTRNNILTDSIIN